jgi:hypothetical protein
MAILTFDPSDVRRIVDHMTAATAWSQGLGDETKPRSQIIFVKDWGIYLISNGEPRDIVEGSTSFAAYARGYDPTTEDFDEVQRKSNEVAGGDDFGEFLDLSADQIKLIKSADFASFSIKLSPKRVEIVVVPKQQ